MSHYGREATPGCVLRDRLRYDLLPRIWRRLRRLHLPTIHVAAIVLAVTGCVSEDGQQQLYPSAVWRAYAAPEEAGWSSDRLSTAKALYDTIGSDAFMAVYDGAVLVAWGDISRRYMCHSVRKSYLSALYGIFVREGRIDLEKTLEEMDIDDEPPLTVGERKARIVDLLRSRSGVYHAAAYETPKMKERRPRRGSKKPGEFWYYNNWDFNALCTILENETGTEIFEEFKKHIADPLQMEDFRLMDTYYHLERQHSIHPAYPFRMSARDMCRFGLLFLREGKWRDLRIIPEDWVEASRHAYSKPADWAEYGYGYMWWVNVDQADRKSGMYIAAGYGGHMIAVLPSENIVFVNRSNTYLGETTQKADLLGLMDAILDAKVSAPKAKPELIPLEVGQHRAEADTSVDLESFAESFDFEGEEVFVGTIPYVIGDMIGRSVRIEVEEGHLLMTDNLGQKFTLVPRSATECLIEDMEIPMLFEMDDQGRPRRITLDASPAWRVFGRRMGGMDQEDRYDAGVEQ